MLTLVLNMILDYIYNILYSYFFSFAYYDNIIYKNDQANDLFNTPL